MFVSQHDISRMLDGCTRPSNAVIQECAKAIMNKLQVEHDGTYSSLLIFTITDKLAQVSPRKRLPLVYLLDWFWHHPRFKDREEFARNLEDRVADISESLDDTVDLPDRSKAAKVFAVWKDREIFQVSTQITLGDYIQHISDLECRDPKRRKMSDAGGGFPVAVKDILRHMEECRTMDKNDRWAVKTTEAGEPVEAPDEWECLKDTDTDDEDAEMPYHQTWSKDGKLMGGVDSAHNASDAAGSLAVPPGAQVCYIWDLDETLVLFQSLKNGDFVRNHTKGGDALMKQVKSLADRIEEWLNDFLDDRMFYREIEQVPGVASVDEVLTFDDNKDIRGYNFERDGFNPDMKGSKEKEKLAYRFRAIRELYLNPPLNEEGRQICKQVDELSDGWITAGRALLKKASDDHHLNIVVTNGDLIPTMAKCILFQLNRYIPFEHIWSSRHQGKTFCFDIILNRFPNVYGFHAIGDGPEEKDVSAQFNVPFTNISCKADLDGMYSKLT
eukprot:GFYU01014906.1.p1 GENE.GFYU01014906.1~~GFYU01014906.1.p1  ORF type:complete len:499 (+),score=114.92 GFYU01014906.1:109-1605(+)